MKKKAVPILWICIVVLAALMYVPNGILIGMATSFSALGAFLITIWALGEIFS